MLADGRDLVAIIALEKRLGKVRDQIAERIIAGETVTAAAIAEAEQAAQRTVKQDFYNLSSRQLAKPDKAGISDDQDFDERGQRLAEHAVWVAHRGLLAIPLVGDPAIAECPEPAP